MRMGGDMSIVCPVCGLSDQIQKVTAIVDSGTSSTNLTGPTAVVTTNEKGKLNYGGGFTTMSGRSITNLAQTLTPHNKPTKKSVYGCGTYLLLALVGLMTIPLIGATAENGNPAAGFFLAVILWGGILWYLIDNNKKKSAEYEAEYKRALAQWEKGVRSWDTLYYCFRDDVVFSAENRTLQIRPFEMNKVLFS